jgi:hypothetical protein
MGNMNTATVGISGKREKIEARETEDVRRETGDVFCAMHHVPRIMKGGPSCQPWNQSMDSQPQ